MKTKAPQSVRRGEAVRTKTPHSYNMPKTNTNRSTGSCKAHVKTAVKGAKY